LRSLFVEHSHEEEEPVPNSSPINSGIKVGINLLLWTDKPSSQHVALLEQIRGWGFDGVEFPVLAMEARDIQVLGRSLGPTQTVH
jgi:hypothetical protein